MSLDAHLIVHRGDFRLDIRLRVAAGEVVALLGPNGAGKTTALRALAGLEPLAGGYLTLAGADLDRPPPARTRAVHDPSRVRRRARGPRGDADSSSFASLLRRDRHGGRRAWTPPERRPIGVVFQDYLLFPHLSAVDNVAFGLRRRGVPRPVARQRASAWLERVGLAEYAQRKPRHLSGGQAQRVALARALAVDPALLLLDEPLAALDARTRLDTRAELHRHLADHPGATLLVTHDPLDALVLADRLVIVEQGRVVQDGDAATITAQPRTDYVARLVGLNLYRGRADGHTIRVGGGFVLTAADRLDGDAFVAFPPTAVALHAHEPDGSPRNTWPATIAGIQRHGDNLRVQLDGPISAAADVTPSAAAHLHLAPGTQVWAAVKATETHTYPATPAPILPVDHEVIPGEERSPRG